MKIKVEVTDMVRVFCDGVKMIEENNIQVVEMNIDIAIREVNDNYQQDILAEMKAELRKYMELGEIA